MRQHESVRGPLTTFIHIVTIDAMSLIILFVCSDLRDGDMQYFHALPSAEYSPSPKSYDSTQYILEGLRKIKLFILVPLLSFVMNSKWSERSFLIDLDRFAHLEFAVVLCRCLNLFMENIALGTAYATFSNLPMINCRFSSYILPGRRTPEAFL